MRGLIVTKLNDELSEVGFTSMDAYLFEVLVEADFLGGHGLDLEDLGFVPRGAAGLVRACGNASLAGAALLACRPALRQGLAMRMKGVRILQPERDPGFRERYIRAMRFGG